LRYLNGFILIGIILLFISVAGMVKGNALLTEPGQPTNAYAWLEYLAAAILMLVNGAVSIWNARRHEQRAGQSAPAEPDASSRAASGPAPAKRREP
jgi:hypothetical protein